MANKINSHEKNFKMVLMAMIMAIMVVLQLVSPYIKIGIVSPSLVLIPIFIGAAMLGPANGAILGAFFGIIALILGITAFDIGTNALFMFKPVETTVICILKGTAAGYLSAVSYNFLMKIFKGNSLLSSIFASIVTPLSNTAIYLVGATICFKDFPAFEFEASASFSFVLVAMFGMVLTNFVVEAIMNVICCPLLVSVLTKNKRFKKLLSK